MAASLTSSIEMRSTESPSKPVWERVMQLVTPSGGHAAQTVTIPLNGLAQKLIVACPATQATGQTFTLTIHDDGDNEIFALGSTAEDDVYIYDISEPFAGSITVTSDFEGGVGTSDHTLTITMRGV